MSTTPSGDSLEEQIADLQRQLDRFERRVTQNAGAGGAGRYFWIVIGVLALLFLTIHDVKRILDRILRQLPRQARSATTDVLLYVARTRSGQDWSYVGCAAELHEQQLRDAAHYVDS